MPTSHPVHPARCRRSWLAVGILLLACGGAAPGSTGATDGTHPPQPPPKPGTSITHTRMCTCTRCEPRECCSGDLSDAESSACGDGYDFASGEGCGMAIVSCVGRCAAHVWRVPLSASCQDPRPAECCEP